MTNIINISMDMQKIGTFRYQGEHNKTKLVFTLSDDFDNVSYINAEFECADKTKLVVENLIPNNGIVEVVLTQEILSKFGKLSVQLVGYTVADGDINVIVKSHIFKGVVEESIEASQPADVDPSFIERLQAWLIESREILETLYPDWDENDQTSRAYIANRTHWHEEATVTRNYTVEWTGTTPIYQQQPWNATELGVVLIEGKNYVLNVAGETFDGACQKIVIPSSEEVVSTVYYIGNIGIFDGTDTGDGFPVFFAYAELSYASTGDIFERINALMTYSSFFGNDISFSITNEETVYHKLPNEYLDDELFRAIQYSHSHNNKKTLDALRFPLAEYDYGQTSHESDKYLQVVSAQTVPKTYEHLRKCEDGGVIKRVETVTKPNGDKVIRIVTNDSPNFIHSIPRFIDIPIQTSAQEKATDEGVTINGIAVDLGFGELEEEAHDHSNKSVLDNITQQTITNIAENTAARHTHTNSNLLRSLSYVQGGFADNAIIASLGRVPGLYPKKQGFLVGYDTFTGSIDSNVEYVFGTAQNPAASIVITALNDSVDYQVNEFFIDFYSGSTPTTITLPASVEWVDELTAEANKHYQISILDNVALWCAVDVEAVNE